LSIKTTHTTRDLVHGRLAHQPTPPGETGPDRLAVPAHRQAPALFQTPLFSRHRLAEHTVPPGASQCRPSHARAIAWRLSVDRQAPYQNNIFWFMTLQLIQFTILNPFHRSHKNPNLNPHISKPTNIICKQIHVPITPIPNSLSYLQCTTLFQHYNISSLVS